MSGPPASIPRHASGRSEAAPGVLDGLMEHAERSPEQPALFHPEGLDMRWRSWRSLAEQAAAGAVALRGTGLSTGEAVGFRWRGHPDAVAADLAVQWAGGSSTPCSGPAEAAAAGGSVWLLQPGEERPGTASDMAPRVVPLPAAERPWERRGAGEWPEPPEDGGGGAWVVERDDATGGSLAGRRLSAAELADDAHEIGERLAAVSKEVVATRDGGGYRGREIALVCLDASARDGRALLSWGLTSGAALVLEPDPRAVPASAAWARPTLVAAEAAPLVELARQLRRREEGRRRPLRRRRGPDRPFGRLRLLVVLGGGRLPVDDVPFWAERGVVVLRA